MLAPGDLSPLATRTVSDNPSVLENFVSRSTVDIGRMPLRRCTDREDSQWID